MLPKHALFYRAMRKPKDDSLTGGQLPRDRVACASAPRFYPAALRRTPPLCKRHTPWMGNDSVNEGLAATGGWLPIRYCIPAFWDRCDEDRLGSSSGCEAMLLVRVPSAPFKASRTPSSD